MRSFSRSAGAGKSDPYVKVYVGSQKKETRVISKELNPVVRFSRFHRLAAQGSAGHRAAGPTPACRFRSPEGV